MNGSKLGTSAVAALVLAAACAHPLAQAPAPVASPSAARTSQASPAGPAQGAATDSARGTSTGPKPYPKVITKDAKTRSGMFKTHLVGEKLYFEIPSRELNKDMLLVGRFHSSAPSPGDFDGYGGDQF